MTSEPALRRPTTDAAASVGTHFHGQRARADTAVESLPEEHRGAIDRDRPIVARWQGERHLAHPMGFEAIWLNGPGEHSARRGDGELHLERLQVGHLSHDASRSGWWRRLDQRARRCQDGQRDAEGDGPQHGDILASTRKARPIGSFFYQRVR